MAAPDPDTEILDVLLGARDEGRDLDLAELQRRFPGHEERAERIWRATERYERGVPEVEAPCGVGPGERVGDFLLERLLGAGGMGHVFLARQMSLGKRRVALKLLPGTACNQVNLMRFEREAAFLAELHHPRLAEVYGFGQELGVHYIAMRFVDGRTLNDVLRDLASRRMDPEDDELGRHVLRIATDIAEALAVVHGAQLMHRDVKPSNIVLERGPMDEALSGHAVLVDFGLVRALNSTERTETGYSAATPAYASPEQLLNLAVDPSSDIFSLGVTLHDLLTRRLPRERRQASTQLEPLAQLCPGMDPDLAAVIGKMVETDPRWRYPDAAPLLADLRALQAGQIVSARFPPLLERARRWVQRDPLRLLRGGALLAAGIALLFFGSLLFSTRAQAREARAAWHAGDLTTLVRSAPSLGPITRWILGESPVGRSLQSLREPQLRTALQKVALALRERVPSTALREAATPLRLNGLASDPLLARFLLYSLGQEVSEGLPREAREDMALRIVARLFFERPVETMPDLEASAPFRSALLERWQRSDLALDERLLLLSAFSGLGTIADAAWILDWASAQAVVSEGARLALAVSERILRRTILLGDLADIDHVALRRRVLDVASPAYGMTYGPLSQQPRVFRAATGAAELARALAALRRHVGLRADLDPLLTLLPTVDSTSPGFWELFLRAANQEAPVIPGLQEGRHLWSLTPTAFHSWGVLCGLTGSDLDEAAMWAAARERVGELEEPLPGDCLSQLDAGLRQGQGLLLGLAPHFDPDQDTRLGATADSGAWLELEVESGVAPTEVAGKPTVFGSWRARSSSISTWGLFGAPSGRVVRSAKDERGRHYIALSQPGLSAFRVPLRVAADAEFADASLAIRYQVGARVYVPYCGEVSLELLIDGKPLGERRALFARDLGEHVVELPRELIPPGEHELTLRLGYTTNTTFRLYGMEVRGARR